MRRLQTNASFRPFPDIQLESSPPSSICDTILTNDEADALDRFSLFFAFYGLILGLAVTELLGGFAAIVRARAIRRVEPQTALLAVLVFIIICVTWIDAWNTLRSITLNLAGLWAPILLATLYFLAASVVFPSDAADFERLATYFAERKRFVIGMLFLAECLVNLTFLPVYAANLHNEPAVFWLWNLPQNLAISGTLIALLFVQSRRANITLLALLILLFLAPYWEHGAMRTLIAQEWGYDV